jgi:ABC-type polysaccharide/polyol phosphate transport system ATPase subunit
MVITFERVSKKFVLPHERDNSNQLSPWSRFWRRREWRENFWALQDVSFQIKRGESVGLIGANGSGKSTILKLITKILQPTSGRVQTQGRIAALLEVGAGFHPDLSGRDNIYLNGSIFGLSHTDIKKLFDEMVAFAELERFIDTPVKYYSSGMYARLGFAIAVHVQPDVLLIDEVLAVGDQAFQDKCLLKIRDFRRQGVTIVLVSHNLQTIGELCERGIWIDKGYVREDSSINYVTNVYLSEIIRKERQDFTRVQQAQTKRWGSGEIEITHVEFCNEHRESTTEFQTGQTFIARLHYRAYQCIESPVFGCAIYRADGVHINGPNTDFSNYAIPWVNTGEGIIDYVVTRLPLLAGNYFFSAVVYDKMRAHAFDHQHMQYPFSVLAGGVKERYGLVHIASHWEHHHA